MRGVEKERGNEVEEDESYWWMEKRRAERMRKLEWPLDSGSVL